MEGSISTSVSSTRTLYQPQTSESGQDLCDQRGQQLSMGSGDAANGPGAVECTQSQSSGVLVSEPSSPLRMHALVLPSPPDSPGGSPSPSVDTASESSLPSVSSSFFFSSSAPGSPGHSHPGSYPSSHPHSDHEREQGHGSEHEDGHGHGDDAGDPHQRLIIPSLALPEALRRPTPFGKTLGELRVLVLGAQGAGKSFLTGLLLEDNEHVIDVGTWEDWTAGEAGEDAHGKVLRASTDWVEQRDMYGAERFEPAKNVEIVELPGYPQNADATELISRLKSIIEGPFRALHDILHPDSDPSGVVASLLASPTSPLYTALIFLLPSPSTPLDKEIIHSLSAYIPVIVLSRTHDGSSSSFSSHHRSASLSSSLTSASKLSAFRPATAVALRTGLFHSPETVALLRGEAADRFLRWREVERAVEGIWQGSQTADGQKPGTGTGTLRAGRAKTRRASAGRAGEWAQRGSGAGEAEPSTRRAEGWSKAKWEAEWMEDHAQEVARRMREAEHAPHRSRTGTMLPPLVVARASSLSESAPDTQSQHVQEATLTATQPTSSLDPPETSAATTLDPNPKPRRSSASFSHTHTSGAAFDPLHLPSLLMFSVSLLVPLRERVVETLRETRVQVALVGGFCVGVGVGVWFSGW